MLCPKCKQDIKDDARFCGKCGAEIPRCPTCGKVLTKRSRFCTNDGTPIPEDILKLIPEEQPASPEANKKSFCIKCGKPCTYGEKLCESCKNAANPAPAPKAKSKNSTNSNKNKKSGGILPLVIIIIVAYENKMGYN